MYGHDGERELTLYHWLSRPAPRGVSSTHHCKLTPGELATRELGRQLLALRGLLDQVCRVVQLRGHSPDSVTLHLCQLWHGALTSRQEVRPFACQKPSKPPCHPLSLHFGSCHSKDGRGQRPNQSMVVVSTQPPEMSTGCCGVQGRMTASSAGGLAGAGAVARDSCSWGRPRAAAKAYTSAIAAEALLTVTRARRKPADGSDMVTSYMQSMHEGREHVLFVRCKQLLSVSRYAQKRQLVPSILHPLLQRLVLDLTCAEAPP